MGDSLPAPVRSSGGYGRPLTCQVAFRDFAIFSGCGPAEVAGQGMGANGRDGHTAGTAGEICHFSRGSAPWRTVPLCGHLQGRGRAVLWGSGWMVAGKWMGTAVTLLPPHPIMEGIRP